MNRQESIKEKSCIHLKDRKTPVFFYIQNFIHNPHIDKLYKVL